MALILSTSKKSLILSTLSILLSSSCSTVKKNDSKIEQPPVKVEVAQFPMGPTTPSSTVFKDMTAEYGLNGVKAVHLYAVDVNNDGFTDLIAMEDFYSAPKFYLFDKKLNKFKLAESPFDSVVRASYLNFVDLDHDGVYDVIVGTLNQKTEVTQYPARIFRGILDNGKIQYREMAPLPTQLLPTSAISVFDYDLDGELDLFLSNWYSYKDKSPMPVPDMLLKGRGFEFFDQSLNLKGEYDYSKSNRQYVNATPTFGASICDVDQNGFPDILTTNSNGFYNKLWLNLDGQNYVNYGIESGYGADSEGSLETLGGGNSFFSLCGDYNKDGYIDIAIGTLSKESDPETRDKSSMLTGASNKFPPKYVRSEFYRTDLKARWSEGDRRGVWIDYNLDSHLDLIIDNSGFPPDSRLVLFEQAADHAYEDKAAKLGVDVLNPSGTITIDVNKDGVMDFITGQSITRAGDATNRIYVFVNQTNRENRGSVRFHLKGRKSNTHGISSSLKLTTSAHKYFFNNEYNSGSLASQNEEGAYFSFDKEMPQDLEVRWSYGVPDRLGRIIPVVKHYNLKKLKLKGSHHELNVCEDGRLLDIKKSCD
jgi:PBP1b-binding outer membrane lipoprotein LpoB